MQVCHSTSAQQGCAGKAQQKLCYAAGVLELGRVCLHRSGGQQARQVLASTAAVLVLAHGCLPAAATSCADSLRRNVQPGGLSWHPSPQQQSLVQAIATLPSRLAHKPIHRIFGLCNHDSRE